MTDDKKPRRDPIDPARLPIEIGLPIPPRKLVSPGSRWVPKLQKLEVGESFKIPERTPAQVAYIRRIGKGVDCPVTMRAVNAHDEDDGVWGTRIWRVDDTL
jgi:hypothetical protein